jgi:calcium-dependent protein kinase
VGTAYCIAPEVIAGGYGQKCDEWNIGVIMYLLLSGNPPFTGDTDQEIMRNIRYNSYTLESEEWESISPQAKDLLKRLLEK